MDGHYSTDIAELHAFFFESELIKFASGFAMAFKTRLSHVERFGIAKHTLSRRFISYNTIIRFAIRVFGKSIEGRLLEFIRGRSFEAR